MLQEEGCWFCWVLGEKGKLREEDFSQLAVLLKDFQISCRKIDVVLLK